MTESELGASRSKDGTSAGTTTNTASHGSWVGIQAEAVHNSNVYMIGPDPLPETQFEVGVRVLENGVPGKARKLIAEAAARGLDSAKVQFHLVLAMLSKRSYNDLDVYEREQLKRLPELLSHYEDDKWRRALTAVLTVVDVIDDSKIESDAAVNGINALPQAQRDMIIRHLDLVLTGRIRDLLWARIRNAAEKAQKQDDRSSRAWIYFQPDPVQPRWRNP